MLRYLVPKFSRGELAAMVCWSVAGALVAGGFGILHDQLTFTLSPEYFTRMKFDQFSAFRGNLPPRAFVAVIGFLATWWFGLIATWLLARVVGAARLRECLPVAWLGIAMGTCFGGLIGAFAGPHFFLADAVWRESATALGVTRLEAFAKVAGIHLGSYVGGGMATLVLAVRWRIRRD